jgi:hypothetical protein
MRGMELLEKTSGQRFERRLVLSTSSPFGLPLRVDLPGVEPTDWEDDEEDGD